VSRREMNRKLERARAFRINLESAANLYRAHWQSRRLPCNERSKHNYTEWSRMQPNAAARNPNPNLRHIRTGAEISH
jgi:hypothetical protein